MIADDTEGLPITQGNNISLCLTFDQVEETKHVYDQLIEKAVRHLVPLWSYLLVSPFKKRKNYCCKVENKCLISILKNFVLLSMMLIWHEISDLCGSFI